MRSCARVFVCVFVCVCVCVCVCVVYDLFELASPTPVVLYDTDPQRRKRSTVVSVSVFCVELGRGVQYGCGFDIAL